MVGYGKMNNKPSKNYVGPFDRNQFPVHVGVYIREIANDFYVWAKWDGEQWCAYCHEHANAEKENSLSGYRLRRWWGMKK